jgi:hypothetical protein
MTPLGIFGPYRASMSKALDNSSYLNTTFFIYASVYFLVCLVRYSLHHPNNAIPTPYQSLRIAAHHPRALKLPPLLLPKLSDTQLLIARPSAASHKHHLETSPCPANSPPSPPPSRPRPRNPNPTTAAPSLPRTRRRISDPWTC